MYTFKDRINIDEYKKFYEQYSKAPIMQDYAWTIVKDNWDSTICGLYKDDTLVATALILIKRLPFNYCLFYIPRGYLMDYTDKKILQEFTKHIKLYAKSRSAYVVKIDPYIAFYERRVHPLDDNEEYHFYSEHVETIIDNLKHSGYIHKGYSKEIGAYLQPRYTMVVPLISPEGTFFNKKQFLKTLRKNVRGYLGDYHEKRGVIFNHSTNLEDLDEFLAILNKTEARQNISLRNKTYFEKMMKAFKDRAILFFGRIDINKYLTFIEESLDDKNLDRDFLLKQKEIANDIKATRGEIITTSAAMVILPGNKEGIKMVEFLYAGNDISVLPNLKINNGLTYYRLMYCLEHEYQYANLGGVDGSLQDHLSTFKSKFNPLVLEFIGEYDLPINKFIYNIINTLEPIIKRIFKLIRH